MPLRVVTALVGAALALVGLAGAPSPAEAKPYRVRIESKPTGATVYLDTKEGDPLGQTPYTGKLPAGQHTLIVELDGYVSQVQDVTIRRRRKVQRISVKLSKIEVANLEVVADTSRRGAVANAKGARILVDGKEVGRLPATINVPAGPHQIEVAKEGYKTYETWIEAPEGEKVTVAADLAPLAASGTIAAGKPPAGGGAPGGNPGGSQAAPGPDAAAEEEQRLAAAEEEALRDSGDDPLGALRRKQAAKQEAGRLAPFFAIGGGFELGGRRYRADSDSGQALRTYDAGAVPIFRFVADVNPFAFASNRWISGWGVFGSYAFATPLESGARLSDGRDVQVPTDWSELDLGLRFRYQFLPATYVGIEGGYGRHAFGFDFSETTEELAREVPDVDYEFWRVGLEGRYRFGTLSVLAGGGTRFVSSIGRLGEAFTKTDVLALHGSAGLAATLARSFEVRLVGRYDHYSHEYTAMDEGPLASTTTGLDQFFGVMLSAFFIY
jgi:PEGA domain